MSYLKYVIFAILSVFIDLSCRLLLNWLVVPFADKAGNLPRWLYWFQTFDATLDEGMLARRREIEAGLTGKTRWRSFIPFPKNAWETYRNRTNWLFRNTGYGFDYFLLGLKWDKTTWKVLRKEDTADRSVFVAVSPNAFNFYYRGKWGRCNIGWKARNMYDDKSNTFSRVWADGKRVPLVVSYNPFKHK